MGIARRLARLRRRRLQRFDPRQQRRNLRRLSDSLRCLAIDQQRLTLQKCVLLCLGQAVS